MTGGRVRDPQRRERILEAASTLMAEKGFTAASMTEIGATAGVTGPAIYRHFDGKSAVLVALLDRAIDGLLGAARAVVASAPESHQALDRLVRHHVEWVVRDRSLAQVYFREGHELAEPDRRRLRRKQRQYLAVWVALLQAARPGLERAQAATMVHAALGTVQSDLFHADGTPVEERKATLAGLASAVLAWEPS
ncbi:MAG: TetR/AcrR family transcriptional regulator [Acidimicrobiales bacterium]